MSLGMILVDGKGRVTIPECYCKLHGWVKGTRLDVSAHSTIADAFIVQRIPDYCDFCDKKTKKLLRYTFDQYACPSCITIQENLHLNP